ncbi:geranylgeranyl transferase type-2 subunit alpha [Vairimorpha necatrix]|uniref:Geranylgeranyl transferase type-2 subunit alpha n=1 Tax=Vairimorpha necatrix TaxID=6039 RepID=A0AAX4JGM2_9MICR
MILHNTKEGEYSENVEILEKIIECDTIVNKYERYMKRLSYCTEDYKAWNYLKKKFLEDQNVILSQDFSKLSQRQVKDDFIKSQLNCTVKALGFNPKSYEAWYHRYFIIKNNLNLEEKDLLLLLIKLDKRNLHCWNYINKLYSNFDFIPKDVSNYSYLHYARGFAPLSCIFTDLKNQGMWFYYAKLREEELLEKEFYIRKYKEEICVIFREPFEGSLKMQDKTFSNMPILCLTLPLCNFEHVFVNDKIFKMKKFMHNEKYFKEIEELEENCIFNKIFNLDLKWELESKGNKYLENIKNDKYEIYIY